MSLYRTPINILNNCKKHAVLVLLMVLLVGLGVRIYQDYNISSDEQVERTNGIVSLTYLADKFSITRLQHDPVIASYRHIPPLQVYMDRDYPVGFNLPMAMIERALGMTDDRDVFFMRHLFTHLIFLCGVIAIYTLAARRFGSWQMGVFAAGCLILSPRFFAESFYNNKDIVFMSCFALATVSAIAYVQRPSFKTAIWHALACALAMDIRIMAVILPLLTFAFLWVRVIKSQVNAKLALQVVCIYLGLLMGLVLLTWPWLWADPVGHFMQAFANMAKFRWQGQMLFDGRLIVSTQLPWNYLPVWIIITTPLLYSVLFIVGTVLIFRAIVKRKFALWGNDQEMQDVFFLSLFFAPVIAVIVLHSVLYDGWRQMYFIYPAFLLIACKGFYAMWTQFSSRTFFRGSLLVIIAISFILTAHWMVTAHPFQNVYFNALVKPNWKTRFDLDYWGLANRQALEWILKNDERAFINVWQGSLSNVSLSLKMLPKAQRERLGIVERAQDADYILTNYRLNPTDYGQLDQFAEGQFVLARHIKVGDEVIESVYQRTAESRQYSDLPEQTVWHFAKNESQHPSAVNLSRDVLQRGGGWASAEIWGTWSLGHYAKLVLPYPQNHPKTITFELNAFITPAHPTQSMIVSINSGAKHAYTLHQAQDNVITLQLPAHSGPWLTLNFEFPQALIPKEQGLGPDDRTLAIGLVRATFR